MIESVDRAWWARVIIRADVVDTEYVRAQGYTGSRNGAVRHYVRGAFRTGFGLNPLFMEQLVSMQLSDAGRVPALYAYLVNPTATVRTSVLWDAPAYARAHPASLGVPGGPLGHAWRSSMAGSTLTFGIGDRGTAVSRADVVALFQRSTGSAYDAVVAPPEAAGILVCLLGEGEGDIAATIENALAAADELSAFVVFALQTQRIEAVVQTEGVALLRNSVVVRMADTRVASVDRLLADVDASAAIGSIVVVRGPRTEVSAATLVSLARAATTGRVAPLWLAEDGTVASAGVYFRAGRAAHLLRHHPAEDARALGETISVPRIAGATFAYPARAPGEPLPARTLTGVTVRTYGASTDLPLGSGPDTDLDELLAPADLIVREWRDDVPFFDRVRADSAPGRVAPPRLRWALKTAAPAGLAAEWWGDTHFARGLAEALRALGQEVVIDSFDAAERPSRYLDDVVLALRGPRPMRPQPDATSLLWIISHPDEITKAEVEGFDLVFAASAPWAAQAGAAMGVQIDPLLQCTDVRRFRPGGLHRSDRIVFVGTARGIARPSVVEPIRAGIPVEVYGPDWTGYIPATSVVAPGIPNSELPALYESATLVLNDHWPAMQRSGFVSNRLFDVVAAGGRAISDEVEGIGALFSGAVLTYRSVPELLDLLRGDIDARFPGDAELARISRGIRTDHSFDARAQTLLTRVLAERERAE